MRLIDYYPNFVDSITSPSTDIKCIALGLCGEAGEFADAVKKFQYHGVIPESNHLDLEVGDILWYVQLYCNYTGTSIENLIEKNVDKLNKRYPGGFTPGGGIR